MRAVVIDRGGNTRAQAQTPMPAPVRDGDAISQDPAIWWRAVTDTLAKLFASVPASSIRALAVDGTSGTLLRTDSAGQAAGDALMYNDARARDQAARIAAAAGSTTDGAGSAAISASSALAKLLWWQDQALLANTHHVLQQADWIAGQFTGHWNQSDANNGLKLGWDPATHCWPDWLTDLLVTEDIDTGLLPEIQPCGADFGPVCAEAIARFGFRTDTRVMAGTTDSIAAFIAAAGPTINWQPGLAVTSLGSTLALKLLSDTAVFSARHGVYSHRLGKYWLAGGASNCGGGTLLKYFSIEQLDAMTPGLQPDQPTGLDYYPLPAPGERFPVNDPDKLPQLQPRPDDDVTFFQGMLEAMANIEKLGYDLLAQLGAAPLKQVYTAGGGGRNAAWTHIRQAHLGVAVATAKHDAAAYGAALIATGMIGHSLS